jgi:hypothetical protein
MRSGCEAPGSREQVHPELCQIRRGTRGATLRPQGSAACNSFAVEEINAFARFPEGICLSSGDCLKRRKTKPN